MAERWSIYGMIHTFHGRYCMFSLAWYLKKREILRRGSLLRTVVPLPKFYIKQKLKVSLNSSCIRPTICSRLFVARLGAIQRFNMSAGWTAEGTLAGDVSRVQFQRVKIPVQIWYVTVAIK